MGLTPWIGIALAIRPARRPVSFPERRFAVVWVRRTLASATAPRYPRHMSCTTVCHDYLDTPLGPLQLVMDEVGLAHVGLPQEKYPLRKDEIGRRDRDRLGEVRRQFTAWFAGELRDFDLPLNPTGTPFQLAVWEGLRRIPYAHTASYGDLARAIDRPRAVRAVGAANGANPMSIIVPCHRVIGSNGSLTGYGGGLDAKRWLLAHERKHAPVEALVLA